MINYNVPLGFTGRGSSAQIKTCCSAEKFLILLSQHFGQRCAECDMETWLLICDAETKCFIQSFLWELLENQKLHANLWFTHPAHKDWFILYNLYCVFFFFFSLLWIQNISAIFYHIVKKVETFLAAHMQAGTYSKTSSSSLHRSLQCGFMLKLNGI